MNHQLEALVTRLLEMSKADATGARRLPPERDLSIALDISRGALREHLAMLTNLGVLRRRQGHGTYIDAPDATFVRTSFTLMRRLDYLTEEQFTDARQLIEETVASEAARRVTDDQVEELRELIAELVERSAADDAEAALEADIAFHHRLYQIVDNPIFNMLSQGLSHVLRDNVRERRAIAASRARKRDDGSISTDTVHQEIVDALAARDPDLARFAMRRHFTDYAEVARSEPSTFEGETL